MDWSYFEQVLKATSAEQLSTLTASFANEHGFDSYSFVQKWNPSGPDGGRFLADHNYALPWANRFRYLATDEAERCDPVIMHIRAEQPPTVWNCRGVILATRPDIRRRALPILHEAAECGQRCGVTIPLQMPGIRWSYMAFTTGSTSDTRDVLPLISPVHTFAHFIQAAVRRIGAPQASAPRLTEREAETLRWSALGKTSWEISTILGISESTVNFHLQAASRRLHVRGRRAAVARALAMGAIEL
jgi:DNA-binding CsgD family transcriptional regulator